MIASAAVSGEPSDLLAEPSSFRDRAGRVFYAQGSVYRGLDARAATEWAALASSRFFQRLTAAGRLVHTQEARRQHAPCFDENWATLLRHDRIPFVSYPYEWCFGMLRDAAHLQLELMESALAEDFILKDASAYNVQWRGAEPVFIDIASFVRLRPGEPWAGYRQFCQLFLYPLMLQAFTGVPFQPWLRGQLDGIAAEQLNRLLGVRDWLRPGVFLNVFLQAKLQSGHARTHRDVRRELRAAGFHKSLIQANVRRLRKTVQRLSWRPGRSEWSNYACEHSYSPEAEQQKQRFVREAAAMRPRNLVWDLGCNTGVYARIAAQHARHVVALDADQPAVERLYQSLKAERNTTILPLVCNLADPSPNLGWRGLERRHLIARGRPDLTLCLALVHHLVIGANIPVLQLIDWLAELGDRSDLGDRGDRGDRDDGGHQGDGAMDLVIEFVRRDDPMVRTLLRNRDDQFTDYDENVFEKALASRFEIVRREPLVSGTRVLYLARSRA